MAKYSELYLPPTEIVPARVPTVYIANGKTVLSPTTYTAPTNSTFSLYGEDVFQTTNSSWPVINATSALNLYQKSVTVQFWFYVTSFNSAYAHIMLFADNRTSAATVQLTITYNSTGALSFTSWTAETGYINNLSTAPGLVALNNWYFLSFHYDFDNSTYSIYLDSSVVLTASGAGYAKDVNTVCIPGGIWDGFSGYAHLGYLADYAVYIGDEALGIDPTPPTSRSRVGIFYF